MVTKKSAPAKKSKGAKSAAGKSSARRKASSRRKAEPPPDDPRLRFEELTLDRRIDGVAPEATAGRRSAKKSSKKAGGASMAAAATAEAAPVPGGLSTMAQMAALRVSALDESRGMPEADSPSATAAPALMPTAASSSSAEESGAPKGAGPFMVAPVAGTSNWVQLGPTAIPNGQTYGGARVLVTGRVTSIVVDPTNRNCIYIGTAQGGVWKTLDGGRNWVAKSDNEVSLAIGALALDPGNPRTLYAGTGEGNFSLDSYYGSGVLRSTNGGDSWTTLAAGTFAGARFGRIAVTPGTPARLLAATNRGVYRSTNGGTDWALLAGGLPAVGGAIAAANDVVIHPTTPTTAYAAFWGGGVYKTNNAGAAAPSWVRLAGGLPTTGFTRVALALSPSSPSTLYALMAGPAPDYLVNRFLRTTDGGDSWTSIPLPGAGNIDVQGFYNLNVAVDPTTPDIVYLSGISVWKATRNSASGAWTVTQVGSRIHPDNHAFAFDPVDHNVVYAGNDGGIYRSLNGGTTWDDSVNEGPCITQFEFISQHPTSDAVVFGGTQDNGTEQFRNSPVFAHADDGDGGFCVVDQNQPRNVLSTYYNPTPKRSTEGGKFETWFDVRAGIAGTGLFYPPLVADDTNPNNVAIGTDRLNLDAAQGTGGWPTKVTLPGISSDAVSAIHYVNSNLIYAGTSRGKVYKLTRTSGTWAAALVSAPPLPTQQIWDISARPGSTDTVYLVMSGFGIRHVWRGVVPSSGAATWTDVSGTGAGTTLPDIPVNALVIDPAAPDTMYIATDVAVYRTNNGGATWTQFSQGLPNCAVFDMRLHAPTRLLRAATHGRGLWERRLDVPSMPDVDLFFRDHLMHTGRQNPSPPNVAAGFEDPLQYVGLGDSLNWWMCADIKVDALEGSPPAYQMNVADVDYVAYEARLQHRNARRGNVNRVYVQVHNRGVVPAAGTVVKLLYANASAGLPPLPPDFWTAFPNNSGDTSLWKPVGTARTIPVLSTTEPMVLEWEWSTPAGAADHTCLLAVMDCPSDPIPPGGKVFDVNALVRNEKRVGLKNLHVVSAAPGTAVWVAVEFFSATTAPQQLRVVAARSPSWGLGLVFPKSLKVPATQGSALFTGLASRKPLSAEVKSLKDRLGAEAGQYETDRIYSLESLQKGGVVRGVKLPKGGARVMLQLNAPKTTAGGPVTFSVVQENEQGELVGGNTFVLRAVKQ